MSDIKGKTIYMVRFGSVTKLKAISETEKGYKAEYKSGNVIQIWRGKRYSASENFKSIFYVEECFFNAQSALKYAREQLKEMEMYHRYKSEEYFKKSGKITIDDC